MSKNAIRMGRWLAIAVAVGLVWATGAWGGKPPAPKYTLVDLDGRPDSVRSGVIDITVINGTITCVGSRNEAGVDKAVLWEVTPAGSGFNVTTHYLTGGEWAMAVNANGEVVGMHLEIDEGTGLWVYRGLYWPDATSPAVELDPLAGDNETECLGINTAGVLVGSSTHKYEYLNPEGQPVRVEEETAVAWRCRRWCRRSRDRRAFRPGERTGRLFGPLRSQHQHLRRDDGTCPGGGRLGYRSGHVAGELFQPNTGIDRPGAPCARGCDEREWVWHQRQR